MIDPIDFTYNPNAPVTPATAMAALAALDLVMRVIGDDDGAQWATDQIAAEIEREIIP